MLGGRLRRGVKMPKYIYIDNWVLNSLNDQIFEHLLVKFIIENKLVVLLSSFSFIELYNPSWEKYQNCDRVSKAVKIYSKVPCVIVDPQKVWYKELQNKLNKLYQLPIELDLSDMDQELRSEVLLKFLRADEIFLSQGKDIRKWVENYKKIKESWFEDTENIIKNGIDCGYLYRDHSGKYIKLSETKETFLYSFDFRLSNESQVNEILTEHLKMKKNGQLLKMTAVRMSSLLFWYLYIDIDPSNKIKQQKSDIGDIYNMCIIPYSTVFTIDSSMLRLLSRFSITENIGRCEFLDQKELFRRISYI